MISKQQLNTIALHSGLSLYQQEKEYLLKLFLYTYYKHYQDAIFKGGTCLKYLLGLERFSEDLDFNIKKPELFKQQVQQTLKRLEMLGVESYILTEELFPTSYTCEIGFHGPLFTGTAQTQNKFRIDAGYRIGTLRKPSWKLIHSEYPETNETFLVLCMDLQEIFVEKILALHERKKGRDLYDIWFLINAGIKFDKTLLQKKRPGFVINLSAIISAKEYATDLRYLTSKQISYDEIKQALVKMIKKT